LVMLWLVWLVGAPVRQAPAGEIAGRVGDPAGAAIAHLTVTLLRADGSPLDPRVTSASGEYRFVSVRDGRYRVEFRLLGYCPVTESVVVSGGAHLTVNGSIVERASPVRCPGSSGQLVVRVETTLGTIDLAVDSARAPVTSLNFLKYVDGHFYDGGRFHRATRADNYAVLLPNRPLLECIQAGINPDRRAEGFPPIPLERTTVTGITHVVGTLSMARGAPDSATSDFFILLNAQPSLDFGGKRFDDAQGAAAFGRVVAGMDIVRRIQQEPVQGQSLTPPVLIVSAHRIESAE
jgi:peptidyl-prolyl cis-trans isomerase A (cyclophilin A)